MFCFENAMFETCKPILAVYIIFVFCLLMIVIVLIRCICSTRENIENKIEDGTPSVLYVRQSKDNKECGIGSNNISVSKKSGSSTQLATDILCQQMEIYKMANYNKIKPSYI